MKTPARSLPEDPTVAAIILAAGTSARMGSPKALLKIGEKTFVEHIVDVLSSAGILNLSIVLGANAEIIRERLGLFGEKIVINERWQDGQLSSVLAGLRSLDRKNIQGILICPVDRPLITREVIADMLLLFRQSRKSIVVPTYKGERGHPVIVGRSLFSELERAPADVGARAVLWSHPEEIAESPTENNGILLNIDTPENYQRRLPS